MVLLSVKSIKGKREYMEDRYVYVEEDGYIVALVCDGHGGHQVANETIRELPYIILSRIKRMTGSNVKIAEKLRAIIISWGEKMKDKRSGSTLTGIVSTSNTLFIVNVGDSRTSVRLIPNSFVYMLKPIFDKNGEFVPKLRVDYNQLKFFTTTDHDASLVEETERVKLSSGTVKYNRLNGVLSVLRAFGDFDVGPGISHIPDVYWINKECIDGPIFLYSDGLYELQRFQNENANLFNDHSIYFMAENTNAEKIVNFAYNRGSEDNITAMLIEI